MGISPLDLHAQDAGADDRGRGHVCFEVPLTVSAAGTHRLHYGPAERKLRVKSMHGYMKAAGGTSVVLQDLAGNAITDVINVAALHDQTNFASATVNDAYNEMDPAAGEGLRIVVVGAVSARLYVVCEPL